MTRFEKRIPLLALLGLTVWLVGCHANLHRAAHEMLTLRADDRINGHKISITPCSHANRQTVRDTAPEDSKHIIKCPNAELVIENEVLNVNGKSYGKLAEKVAVRVEGQKVFINDLETQPVTQVAQN